jgi:hypothetical protein
MRRMQSAFVSGRSAPRGNAADHWKCVFSQGVPAAVPALVADSIRVHAERCVARGSRESLVFGSDEAVSGYLGRFRIPVVRMLLRGYEVIDLFLEHGPSGDWRVVDAVVRTGAFS